MSNVRICCAVVILLAPIAGCSSGKALKSSLAQRLPFGKKDTAENLDPFGDSEVAEASEDGEAEKSEGDVEAATVSTKDPLNVSTASLTETKEAAEEAITQELPELDLSGVDESFEAMANQLIEEADSLESEAQASAGDLTEEFPWLKQDQTQPESTEEASESEEEVSSEESIEESDEQAPAIPDNTELEHVAENVKSDIESLSAQLANLPTSVVKKGEEVVETAETEVVEQAAEAVEVAEAEIADAEAELEEALPSWAGGVQQELTSEQPFSDLEEFVWADAKVSGDELENEVAETSEVSSESESATDEAKMVVQPSEEEASPQLEVSKGDVIAENTESDVETCVNETIAQTVSMTRNVAPSAIHGEDVAEVSPDVLKLLDQAFGDVQWKNAAQTTEKEDVKTNDLSLPPELENIAKLLVSNSPQLRVQGIQAAFNQGGTAVQLSDVLVELLNDDNNLVRANAAITLHEWNQHTDLVLKTLADVIYSNDSNAIRLAALHLGDMTRQKDQVIKALDAALVCHDGMESLYVAEALLKQDPSHAEAMLKLTSLMNNHDAEVRWMTAHALGAVRGPLNQYAVEALRSGLRDTKESVRVASALSLGGLGDHSPIVLAELKFMSTHGTMECRDAAVIALDCLVQ